MSWTFPASWEDQLWDAARDELGAEAVELRVLVPAIVQRSRRYTDERDTLHAPLAEREAQRDLAARALFFTVADAAKVHVPLAELEGRGLLPDRPLSVLDAGAGAGAMTLGLLSFLPGRHRVTAVDRDRGALAILARAAASLADPPDLTTIVADVFAGLPDSLFDLVLAGSLLNEIAAPQRLELARALLTRVAPDGAFVLVEPALRDTARALHEVRDALLSAGAAGVFAPCSRSGPCPALLDPGDWCHEDRPFQPPPRLADLARRTGLRSHGLKLAYLTLRPDRAPLDASAGRALRVVSGPLDQKGTVERIVCSDAGRVRLRVLRRDKELAGRLAATVRGDVLVEDASGALSPTSLASPRR